MSRQLLQRGERPQRTGFSASSVVACGKPLLYERLRQCVYDFPLPVRKSCYHFFVRLRQIFLAYYLFIYLFLSLCPSLRDATRMRFVRHLVWRIFIQNWYEIDHLTYAHSMRVLASLKLIYGEDITCLNCSSMLFGLVLVSQEKSVSVRNNF